MIRLFKQCVIATLFIVVASVLAAAQSASGEFAASTLPRLVKYTGSAPVGVASVTFAIYATEDGLAPLWLETQSVTADDSGHYSVLLGSTKAEGLPSSIFASGEARWIGVKVGDAQESPRTLLVSVPYALKAGDAETLGGKPLSAFLLADTGASSMSTPTTSKRLSGQESGRAKPETTATGDSGGQNFLGKFDATGVNLIGSAVFENNGLVGIGTNAPPSILTLDKSGTGNYLRFSNGGVLRGLIGISGGGGDLASGDVANDLVIRSQQNIIFANSNVEAMRFTNGFVGIGITNPASILHLDHIGPGNYLRFSNGGVLRGLIGISSGGGDLSSGDVANDMVIRSQQNIIFANNNLEAMRFSGGNVGLGSTSPVSILHLDRVGSGNYIRFSNAGTFRALLGISAGGGDLISGDGANDLVIRSQANILFANGSSEAMRIQGGNIGISNTTPAAKLDVSQTAAGAGTFTIGTPPPSAVHGDTTATSGFITGLLGTTSSVDGYGILGENLASGNGIGRSAGVRGITANVNGASPTTAGTGVWGDALQSTGDNVGVFGRSASSGDANGNAGTGVLGQATSTTGDAVGVYGLSASSQGTGVFGEVTNVSPGNPMPAGVFGRAASGTAGLFAVTNNAANLLVGQNASSANVFRVDATGKGFFDGTAVTGGADFAESVAVLQTKNDYEPGDVIAIDTTGNRRFAKSTAPYSTFVAGIYSTRPGLLATKHVTDDPRIASEEIPLAVVGIVPCKVTNENGEINAGDLLVSSSTAGYAMKGTDRTKMTGAVVGKALQAMHGKTGVIEVLVSLQ